MPRASERGQRQARSGWSKMRRGSGEGGSEARRGETQAWELDGLGSHDIHRRGAEGGEGCPGW